MIKNFLLLLILLFGPWSFPAMFLAKVHEMILASLILIFWVSTIMHLVVLLLLHKGASHIRVSPAETALKNSGHQGNMHRHDTSDLFTYQGIKLRDGLGCDACINQLPQGRDWLGIDGAAYVIAVSIKQAIALPFQYAQRSALLNLAQCIEALAGLSTVTSQSIAGTTALVTLVRLDIACHHGTSTSGLF